MRLLGLLHRLVAFAVVLGAGSGCRCLLAAEAPSLPQLPPAARASHGLEAALPMTRAEAEATLQKALHVRQVSSNVFALGEVVFDRQQRTVSLPARINLRDVVIEYALVHASGKTHESLLVTDVEPEQVHLACLLLDLSPAPIVGAPDTAEIIPPHHEVSIEVFWTLPQGEQPQHTLPENNNTPPRNPLEQSPSRAQEQVNTANPSSPRDKPARVTLAELVILRKPATEKPEGRPPDGLPLAAGPWFYNGSQMSEFGFAAQQEGSIISLIRDPAALINNPRPERDDDDAHWPNAQQLPPPGTPVRVVMQFSNKLGATNLGPLRQAQGGPRSASGDAAPK